MTTHRRTNRSLVRNAADPEQVGKAKDAERFREDADRADLDFVLSTPTGRRFLWRVLTHTKSFESIFETSARIYHNSGRQDVGHWLMGQIQDANPEAWMLMQIEANNLQAAAQDAAPDPDVSTETHAD